MKIIKKHHQTFELMEAGSLWIIPAARLKLLRDYAGWVCGVIWGDAM
jgi:hypothetical protein